MKKCLDCDAEVDDQAYVCPKCGGGTLIGSYSPEDALAMLSGLGSMDDASKHVDRSAELYQEGRYVEAKAELEKAIELAPSNGTAHGNMGAVLIAQGKPKDAIPYLERALELNPHLEGIPEALSEARSASNQDGGCFIATACYADPTCYQLQVLREYRDTRLQPSTLGRLFIRAYYFCSPALADKLSGYPRARSYIREHFLEPLVSRIAGKQ